VKKLGLEECAGGFVARRVAGRQSRYYAGLFGFIPDTLAAGESQSPDAGNTG
jgi:hypothetical protein